MQSKKQLIQSAYSDLHRAADEIVKVWVRGDFQDNELETLIDLVRGANCALMELKNEKHGSRGKETRG